ncbi:hypothetical protein SUGI_0862270 [Cryptomeria japonica]|nr:hypothetical protein SUGI_0862270 [Cryptomeria japonica]
MAVGCRFLLIWVIIHFPFLTACLKAERNYLVDFKAGLNLSSGHLSSWRGFNCCEWEVEGQNLSGELRPSLFDLQHLRHFDLSGNSFKGISIPLQFSKMQRLTFLTLSDAGFCGEVPLELRNISSLHHLDISDNDYEYITSNSYCELNSSKFDVWVRNLRSLEFLRMNGVKLRIVSKYWVEAINDLANLTQIHLSYCELLGNIPDLSNLTLLSHLYIAGNMFPFDLPSWFENVSSLV